MRFGPIPTCDALGAVLAHSVQAGSQRLRKGQVLSADHLDMLARHDIDEVIVAQLDPDDLDENAAAAQLADALVPDPAGAGLRLSAPFTGRVNLIADGPGVVVMDTDAIERFNRVHPMITLATVPPFQQMGAGGMVATIKIISYAVPAKEVARACATAGAAIRLAGPVHRTASLIFTRIPGGPDDTKATASITARVNALGMDLIEIDSTPHATAPLADALSRAKGEIAMILTGSATSDIDDVAPSAVRAAGGQVDRFGMPVDPGNLLFLGQQGGRPVIGLPGCARAPALNGADWVLSRVACGIPVTGADIAAMGVGGLLKEIPTRPQPRQPRRGR
ncbi:MAG: molybdopterin-binding protein [Marinibacterium sp.]|nr:molybdopterin-binding protein [Marinibacterium sp.]